MWKCLKFYRANLKSQMTKDHKGSPFQESPIVHHAFLFKEHCQRLSTRSLSTKQISIRNLLKFTNEECQKKVGTPILRLLRVSVEYLSKY